MGISVRHGGDYGDAGKVLAQAIQSERDRAARERMSSQDAQVRLAGIKQQAESQAMAIEAMGQRAQESNAAQMERTVVGAGLQREAQQQAFGNSLESARQQARMKAKAVDHVYTAEQRIKDANLTKAKQAVTSSQYMSNEQKEAALMQIDMSQLENSEPVERLGDPNAPQFEEGFEPGTVHSNDLEGGWRKGYSQVQPDGSRKMIVRPDQTPEYAADRAEEDRAKAEVVQQQKIREAELKRRQALDDKMASARMDLMTMKVDPEKGEKRMTPEQADIAVRKAFGVEKEKEEAPETWGLYARMKDIQVNELDADLPAQVGRQAAIMRALLEKAEGDPTRIPAQHQRAFQMAAQALRNYHGSGGAQ